ncbi:MAG TPA: cell division protein ZapD [Gallionellaceae bacterium]|nr:cell division protein ZapD [Gallionellaceae bacterium]
MISYEFPLNERVRTLLRLEDLYFRILQFIESDDHADHHTALGILFEILEVTSRSELKSELLQELERQKRLLNALHNNPEISEAALEAVLSEIDTVSASLLAMTGKIGQHLRENEWLMSIKQRSCIPGGMCEFDLPSYHYWQHLDPATRRTQLNTWLAPMLPIYDALKILLKLLRENGKQHRFTAQHGSFQQMQGGRVAQMLRISLDPALPCIPEISANKYALNIRFVAADFAAKSTLYDQDLEFDLTFC